MKRSVLMLLLSLFWMTAYAHDAVSEQNQISVVGIGEVEQAPDQAILNVSVNALQPTLPEAKKLADQRYRNVLNVIDRVGISAKFVKATRINAQPQYEWQTNKRVYKGERVSRSLSIIVNDLDKLSPLMQALVENEVSTIDGMSTGFRDRTALQQKALGKAADDAKNKARFLAERLGRNLGEATIIREHNIDTPPVFRQPLQSLSKSSAAVETAPPEMFGTEKVKAMVNVSFNLL